jgi:hypothetical protein
MSGKGVILMNQMIYMQIAGQRREQLLREAEVARLVSQIKKSQHGGTMPTVSALLPFVVLYQQVKLLFSLRVQLRTQNREMITLAQSECALRSTFALMRKNGLVSDYDEHFMQQFTQAFEREVVRQRVVSRAIATSRV